MTPNKLKAEIRRRSGKLTYQGAALESRIKNQMEYIDTTKKLERWARHEYLSCQMKVVAAEDELDLLRAIKVKASRLGTTKGVRGRT